MDEVKMRWESGRKEKKKKRRVYRMKIAGGRRRRRSKVYTGEDGGSGNFSRASTLGGKLIYKYRDDIIHDDGLFSLIFLELP